MAQRRILIVEDEELVAEHLRISLGRWGYEVIGSVATGNEAISIAKESNPDLILMDIFLIGRPDGIEAVQQIHKIHPIPVIYLTASSDPATRERAEQTDFYAYLNKPYRLPQLRSTIQQLFEE